MADKTVYPTVDINDPNFDSLLCQNYDEYGVCVITNVIPNDECNNIMDNIVTNFEKLGTGLDRTKPETWNKENLPVMTRPGMFQATMCNLPVIWRTKMNPHILRIFETLYGKFRGTTDLVVSNDGINIKHGEHGPFNDDKLYKGGRKKLSAQQIEDNDVESDWAHLDQTIDADMYRCIQGQLVMTNTTSAFRCTPKSHKYLYNILVDYGMAGRPDNWFKFNLTQKHEIKEFLENKGCVWQPAIYAPKGSFIVWNSACIHSAKFADSPVKATKEDPFLGWRGVLYISFRPREDMENEKPNMLSKKYGCIKDNRVMNHWGLKIFALYPGGPHNKKMKRHPRITQLTEHPEKVYDVLGINIKEVLEDEKILKYIM